MTKVDPLFRAFLRIRDAENCLVIAHAPGIDAWHKGYNIKQARANIAAALVPDAEPKGGESEEWLVDLIATAITDSTDIDCTSESQARYIVDEMFKHFKMEANK